MGGCPRPSRYRLKLLSSKVEVIFSLVSPTNTQYIQLLGNRQRAVLIIVEDVTMTKTLRRVSGNEAILPSQNAHSYWLHVDHTGTEHRYQYQHDWTILVTVRPDLGLEFHEKQSHRIEGITANGEPYYGWSGGKPKGKGWYLYNSESDHFNIWARPIRDN
jgi:hypothetical protein